MEVSLSAARLWVKDGDIALYDAPVAIGKPVILEYEGREWSFSTPLGRRTILAKEKNPVWTPPDWHYVEFAALQGFKLVWLAQSGPVRLSDGSRVEVRRGQVGRVSPSGRFEAVPVGEEAVFEGTLFVPPLSSVNRRLPGELGGYKLDLGDGYYLHGTPDASSVGGATTHGCIRLLEPDLAFLYSRLPIGTPVFIY